MYLDLPPHLRIPVATLRTRIETARYNLLVALPPDKRSCWFCDNDSIEDELHFLFKCKLYTKVKRTHNPLLSTEFILYAFGKMKVYFLM